MKKNKTGAAFDISRHVINLDLDGNTTTGGADVLRLTETTAGDFNILGASSAAVDAANPGASITYDPAAGSFDFDAALNVLLPD